MSQAVTLDAPALPAPLLPAALPRKRYNKWLVTLSISFGTLMGAIDMSIVNVALPHIRGSVSATVQEITWISTGYAVANVIVMPLTAFLARMFGQKRVYVSCLVLFLVGSILCGFATSLPALVFFRALQGLGAGALQPTEQAILRQTFSPKEQGMAMALFGMAVMLGPAVGPTLGGYIVDHWHWSWIFFINLPVGIVGLLMVTAFVHEDEDIRAANQAAAVEQRKHLDWQGIALLSVGLAALQYFLEEGSADDWFDSKLITGVFVIAVASIVGFIWRELTAKVPAVNIRLFKDPVFSSGTIIGGVMFAMLMANMFLLPVFMQELLGFTATQSGLALMPRTLVMMVAVPIVGRLYTKLSPRLLIFGGILLVAYGGYDMSHLTLASSTADVVQALCFQGVGFACLFVPLTTLALAGIPRTRIADATGLNSLIRQIGGAIGLAIFATMLSNDQVLSRASVAAHLSEVNPETFARLQSLQHGFVARGMDSESARELALRALSGSVAKQGAVLAFDHVFLICGLLFLCVIPLLFFLKGNSNAPKVDTHVEV